MRIRMSLDCPNCEHHQPFTADTEECGLQLVRCDSDSGGCDSTLVVEVEFDPHIKVYSVPALDRSEVSRDTE